MTEYSNIAKVDYNEDISKTFLNGLEPLDSFFAQLEKDENEWLETCKKEVPEGAVPDIDRFLDWFWDDGKGGEARKKIETQYLPRLCKEIAELTQSQPIDISTDVDLMQFYLTFKTPTPLDYDKVNKLIQQWVNHTRLAFMDDKVEWDYEQKDDDTIEIYFWNPWRKE